VYRENGSGCANIELAPADFGGLFYLTLAGGKK
jgi:hypothetical protein